MGDLLNTIMELVADALRAIGLKRPGQKREIKADLELLQVLQATPGFGPDSLEAKWLTTQVRMQMLHLAGVPVPGTRQPIKKGSFVTWLLIGGWFTYWTIQLNENSFLWWSIATGFVAFFALVGGVIAPITNPEVVPWPDQTPPVVPPMPLSTHSGPPTDSSA